MLTSQLIANLEKLKAAVGDLPIELSIEAPDGDFAHETRTNPINRILNTDQVKLSTDGFMIAIVHERNPYKFNKP